MIGILRSLIKTDEDEAMRIMLKENVEHLMREDFIFISKAATKVYDFVKKFYVDYSDLPSLVALEEEFRDDSDSELVAIVGFVKEESKVFTKADFKAQVSKLKKEQRKQQLETLLRVAQLNLLKTEKDKDTDDIVDDSIKSLISKCYEVYSEKKVEKIFGNIMDDKKEFIEDVDKRRKEGGKVGILTGYEIIDLSTRGLRPGELMLIAGFVGECKTTLSLNIAYNVATMLGWNVLYFSVESKYKEIRRILYTMHTTHQKWGREPLSSEDVRDGLISDEDFEFLKVVADDLNDKEKYGSIIVYQPDRDVSVDDLRMIAEMENAKQPLNLIIADYLGRFSINKKKSWDDVALNQILKDAKMLALTFNKGRGIPVISPFQTNRAGKQSADKNDGKYRLDALAGANEAERSADLILYTYLNDELRKISQLKLGCLKNRDGSIFEPFILSVDFKCKRIGESPE